MTTASLRAKRSRMQPWRRWNGSRRTCGPRPSRTNILSLARTARLETYLSLRTDDEISTDCLCRHGRAGRGRERLFLLKPTLARVAREACGEIHHHPARQPRCRAHRRDSKAVLHDVGAGKARQGE